MRISRNIDKGSRAPLACIEGRDATQAQWVGESHFKKGGHVLTKHSAQHPPIFTTDRRPIPSFGTTSLGTGHDRSVLKRVTSPLCGYTWYFITTGTDKGMCERNNASP